MKKISLIIIILIATFASYLIYNHFENHVVKITDNIKIAKEYTLLEEDNVYKYATIDTALHLFEEGSSILFIGFKESEYSNHYIKYVNEVAKDNQISEIYYLDILTNRNSNTAKYQKLTELLKDNLIIDDTGKHKITVPAIVFIKDKKVVAFDNETSIRTNNTKANDYWTQDNINLFKSKINTYMIEFKGGNN